MKKKGKALTWFAKKNDNYFLETLGKISWTDSKKERIKTQNLACSPKIGPKN